MMLRRRVLGVCVGMVIVAAMGMVPSLAQDPAAEKPADKAASAADAGKSKAYRRVPPFFGKIGLTPEQREKIYAIRGEHQEEIDALKAKIDALTTKELAACEGILLETQKKMLDDLRASGKTAKKGN